MNFTFFKPYIKDRLTSVPAWIGALCFVLEIVLHMGNTSLLLLLLYAALVVLPEAKIRGYIERGAENLRHFDYD